MRHLLTFFAVLTYDWFRCRDEREANDRAAAERMTQREWLGIPAAEVDDFTRWEQEVSSS